MLVKFDTAERVANKNSLKNSGGIGIAIGDRTNMETIRKLETLVENFHKNKPNIKRCIIENRWPKP